MIFDYSPEHRKLILVEEPGESFLSLKDKTDFTLCERIRNGKHEVPFIMLGTLWRVAKTLGYRLKATDRLKAFHRLYDEKRKLLNQIKDDFANFKFPIAEKVKAFCAKMERLYNFKYMPAQIETIVYAVVAKKCGIFNEVGTGKTLTINTVAKYLIAEGKVKKVLVLLPASLVKNYVEDYKRFFGNFGIVSISTETKQKREAIYSSFARSTDLEFLVTNIEKCRVDFEFMRKLHFDLIVVDEFHKLKGYKTAEMSKNFFEMMKTWKSEYRFPMSGTPVETKLLDLYPIYKLLQDGFILGGSMFFDVNFVEYEEIWFKRKVGNRTISQMEKKAIGFKKDKLPFLKELVRPFAIRKALELPCGLYEQFIRVDLTKKMRDKYHEIRMSSEQAAKYHAVRQFLCDVTRGGMKHSENPKMDELKNIVDQTDSKVLIFTFYKCSVDAIAAYLESIGYKTMTLKGDDGKDAFEEIRKFKESVDVKCFACTDVINFGHNLQFARIIVNFELPIRPTTYRQRYGRAYRTGQTKDVHVYSFVAEDTVESVIADVFETRREMIKELIEKMDERGMAALEKEIEKKVLQSLE